MHETARDKDYSQYPIKDKSIFMHLSVKKLLKEIIPNDHKF